MPTGGRAGTGYWKLGGRGSWKTRRRTVLKPEYLYMQNVIKWYRNAIQCMHACQWPSWYEVLGVGGGSSESTTTFIFLCSDGKPCSIDVNTIMQSGMCFV